jgi:hypothetical protein
MSNTRPPNVWFPLSYSKHPIFCACNIFNHIYFVYKSLFCYFKLSHGSSYVVYECYILLLHINEVSSLSNHCVYLKVAFRFKLCVIYKTNSKMLQLINQFSLYEHLLSTTMLPIGINLLIIYDHRVLTRLIIYQLYSFHHSSFTIIMIYFVWSKSLQMWSTNKEVHMISVLMLCFFWKN